MRLNILIPTLFFFSLTFINKKIYLTVTYYVMILWISNINSYKKFQISLHVALEMTTWSSEVKIYQSPPTEKKTWDNLSIILQVEELWKDNCDFGVFLKINQFGISSGRGNRWEGMGHGNMRDKKHQVGRGVEGEWN